MTEQTTYPPCPDCLAPAKWEQMWECGTFQNPGQERVRSSFCKWIEAQRSAAHVKDYDDPMYRDTPHHFDPDHPETRKLIDEHKADRLANPWKAAAFEHNKQYPVQAFKLWVEQVGDAELYHRAYKEGRAR